MSRKGFTSILILFIVGISFIGAALYFIIYQFSFSQPKAQINSAIPNTSSSTYVISAYDDSVGTGTGDVHIVFSDGRTFISQRDIVNQEDPQAGSELPLVATDKQTVGWLATYPNDATSYPIPLTLVIYRKDRVIQKIDSDLMIWNWMFVDDGAQAAMVVGLTHGTDIGYYRLYNVTTGKLVAEINGPLSSASPQWAIRLDAQQ